MLGVSIAHLPHHQMRNPAAFPGVVIYAAHGASDLILWVPDDPDRWAMAEPVPDEILVIQRYARRHGCDYVLFDPNGPPVEGLPRWSW